MTNDNYRPTNINGAIQKYRVVEGYGDITHVSYFNTKAQVVRYLAHKMHLTQKNVNSQIIAKTLCTVYANDFFSTTATIDYLR